MSNSVHNLINITFSSLSFEQKLTIKNDGRPLPELKDLMTKYKKGKKEYFRNYNLALYLKNEWLCGCEINQALFCFPCLLFGGETAWTKTGVTDLQHLNAKIVKHENSFKHIHNATNLNLLGKVDDRQDIIQRLWKDINHRRQQLSDIEQSLPKPNGTYLKIILGNVNVSILNKEDKFRYKDEYEKFKLVLSIIGFFLSLLNLVTHRRGIELTFLFLLVWYYCTLTIRESILKVNGSKIKGWWRVHHFISTVASAVLLVWPNSETWFIFRPQFMIFNVVISVVQSFQFIYQQGVLYRLKALGERHNMDITIEGFHSWMWRGLSFLLPFLYVGYIFQLYNAYTLYKLCYHPHATWQVPVLSGLFFILFLGNAVTTSMVIPEKLREVKIRRIIKTYTRKMSGNRLGADPKKSD